MSPPKTVTFNPNLGQESRTSPQNGGLLSPAKMITVNSNLGVESRTVSQSFDPAQHGQHSVGVSGGGEHGDRRKAVTFDPVEDVVCEGRWMQDGGDGRQRPTSRRLCRNQNVPEVKPGVQMEEHKKKVFFFINELLAIGNLVL